MIQKAAQTLAECNGGESPKGWLGPWISESLVTPDLLQVCCSGCWHVLGWCARHELVTACCSSSALTHGCQVLLLTSPAHAASICT